MWVKIKPPGDRSFQSLVPFTRAPFWVPILDPQPNVKPGGAKNMWRSLGFPFFRPRSLNTSTRK